MKRDHLNGKNEVPALKRNGYIYNDECPNCPFAMILFAVSFLHAYVPWSAGSLNDDEQDETQSRVNETM